MVHYVFQVAWYCSLGMSSIFSILWPVTAAKTIRVSFRRLTTLWDQTIVIDITLVIFTNISWLTSKDLFCFFFGCWNSNVPILGLGLLFWCHGFQRKLWECRKRCRGDGSRSFFGMQKNKGTMQFETWTWRWFWTFFLSSLSGEMIEFDDHIFQTSWNHQLDQDLFFLGWSLWSCVSRIGSNRRTTKKQSSGLSDKINSKMI